MLLLLGMLSDVEASVVIPAVGGGGCGGGVGRDLQGLALRLEDTARDRSAEAAKRDVARVVLVRW